MKFHNFLITCFILFAVTACSEKKDKVSLIKEDNLEQQMIEAYNEGLKEFNRGDIFALIAMFAWSLYSTLLKKKKYELILYF